MEKCRNPQKSTHTHTHTHTHTNKVLLSLFCVFSIIQNSFAHKSSFSTNTCLPGESFQKALFAVLSNDKLQCAVDDRCVDWVVGGYNPDARDDNWICPGGDVPEDATEGWGIYKCASNQIPDWSMGYHFINNTVDWWKQNGSQKQKCCNCPDGWHPNTQKITVEYHNNSGETAYHVLSVYTRCIKEDKSTYTSSEAWGEESRDFKTAKCNEPLQSVVRMQNVYTAPPRISPNKLTINPVLIGGIEDGYDTDDTETYEYVEQCNPGYVAYNGKCVSCTYNEEWARYARSKRMYCPGGEYVNSSVSVTNQMTKCPKMMEPTLDLSECDCIWGVKNADGTACVNIVLTSEDLKCGPAGCSAPLYKQCWTKKSPKAYRKCMGFD